MNPSLRYGDDLPSGTTHPPRQVTVLVVREEAWIKESDLIDRGATQQDTTSTEPECRFEVSYRLDRLAEPDVKPFTIWIHTSAETIKKLASVLGQFDLESHLVEFTVHFGFDSLTLV